MASTAEARRKLPVRSWLPNSEKRTCGWQPHGDQRRPKQSWSFGTDALQTNSERLLDQQSLREEWEAALTNLRPNSSTPADAS
jgi:hypothetical protein